MITLKEWLSRTVGPGENWHAIRYQTTQYKFYQAKELQYGYAGPRDRVSQDAREIRAMDE